MLFRRCENKEKNFEIRKDEDDIQPGDNLILCEYTQDHYTGREISRNVKYVLRNVPQFGLQDGYCIIGFLNLEFKGKKHGMVRTL